MNDNKANKRKTEGRSLNFSPRRDNKPQMRKFLERDQQFNQTSTSYGQLEKHHTAAQFDLLRQSTNVSTVKRRSIRKQSPSQKLNQLLLGKLGTTENKIKDTELSLKKLEDLHSEIEQKLGCTTGERLSSVEHFRKLLDSYDENKLKMEEVLSKNADLEKTITDLNKRIVENSDFYRKEQVRFKNEMDRKEIENQRLLEKIEKLTVEKADMLERVNKLQVHLDHVSKLPKAICQECKMEIQNSTLGANPIIHREFEEKSNPHPKSPNLKTIDNRCKSAESSATHHRVRRPIKSDSEIHKFNASEISMNSPRPLSSRMSLVGSARSNSNISISSISSGRSYKKGQSRKRDSEQSRRQILGYENPRSNTDISSSSSFLSFANESEGVLSSRESSSISFANSTYSR